MLRTTTLALGLGLWLSVAAVGVEPSTSRVALPDLPSRWWTDDTGLYRAEGRLVATAPDRVVLLKQNQRHSMVPLHRLSAADRDYVRYVQSSLERSRQGVAGDRDELVYVSVAALPALPGSLPAFRHEPALYVNVSADLLRQFNRQLTMQRHYGLCILGVPVYGIADTSSHLTIGLGHDPQRAVLELPVTGSVSSDSTAYSSRVQIHSHGSTAFTKRLVVTMDAEGAQFASEPVQAVTTIVTTGIDTSARWLRRLTLRMAERQLRARKPLADSIATTYQQQQLDSNIDAAGRQIAARLTQRLQEALAEFSQTGALRDLRVAFSTTGEQLQLAVFLPAARSLGTAPVVPATDSPVIIRIHRQLLDSLQGDRLDEVARIADRLIPNSEGRLRELLGDGNIDVVPGEDHDWVTMTLVPEP